MGVSGNSVAIKSFQSFTINDGLLQKVVEAVKSGEHEAHTSGIPKSFEVFYRGFRQNISIGKIYIVPAKVCDNPENFPTSLLYGTVVRELNLGEEVADLISHKIGDTEFDEYSQADYSTIKEKLFTGEDGKLTSLIIYAPNWSGIREYIGFKYTSDDTQLANLLRHLVFSAYFNPSVSSAFNALATTMDTSKFDVTDITPKLTYPFLSENLLKGYPDLTKVATTKKKVYLTAKTADEITKDALDPEELNVFEALDTALIDATQPETDSMDGVADFKGPEGSNEGNLEIPEVSIDSEGIQHRPEGIKESNSKIAEECPTCGNDSDKDKNNSGNVSLNLGDVGEAAEGAAEAAGGVADAAAAIDAVAPLALLATRKAARFDRTAVKCPNCGEDLDAFGMCPNVSVEDAKMGIQFCNKGEIPNTYLPPLFKDKNKSAASFETPFTNVGPGIGAHDKEDQSVAAVDTLSQKGESPIGIAIDETGVARRPEEERKVAVWTPDPKYLVLDALDEAEDRLSDLLKGRNENRIRAEIYNASEPSSPKFTEKFITVNFGEDARAVFVQTQQEFKELRDNVFSLNQDSIQEIKSVLRNIQVLATIINSTKDRSDKSASSTVKRVARELTRDIDDDYIAMSNRARIASQKHEADMDKKYRKQADVPMTEESIWDDLTTNFGEAPQVELPSGGYGSSKKKLPEAMTSDKPEETKGEAEKPSKAEETALENPKTKSVDSGEEKKENPSTSKSKLFQKKDAGVECDISEAKCEVVSPDTVDVDIKQPTESVEQLTSKKASTIGHTIWEEDDGVTHWRIAKRNFFGDEEILAKGEATDFQDARNQIKQKELELGLTKPHEASVDNDQNKDNSKSEDENYENDDWSSAEDDPDIPDDTWEHLGSAGDENEEAVEMSLGFGDLADLAANLPHQDEVTIIAPIKGAK